MRRFLHSRALPTLLLATLASCAWMRPKPPEYEPFRTDSGLIVHDLVIPDAGEIAQPEDHVIICYTLRLEDGTQVDSSLERGQPIGFQIGAGEMPGGLEEGIIGMRLFGRRELIVPPHLGYGADGRPPFVPPNATLRFEVELMGIQHAY